MDFTYALANCQHAPDLRFKFTDGQKQCCIHRQWNIRRHWLNTPGMTRTNLTGWMKLPLDTSRRMTITLLVHPTTKQVSILNLPTIQLWSLVVSDLPPNSITKRIDWKFSVMLLPCIIQLWDCSSCEKDTVLILELNHLCTLKACHNVWNCSSNNLVNIFVICILWQWHINAHGYQIWSAITSIIILRQTKASPDKVQKDTNTWIRTPHTCLDHLSTKMFHLSNKMIEFLVHHCAALSLANNPLI
jgi:hypothetical protein